MAYQNRPNYDTRSPIMEHEHRHSPWMSQEHPQHHHHRPSAGSPSPPHDVMDPESEDSDVSAVDGGFSTFAFFKGLPPAPSKQALESQHSIQARLEELEQIENQNIKTHKELKVKRARMDEKIASKRAAQDQKIKAIIDSRARRDSRIKQRRDREDIAFQRFYEDHEEEDNRLRQRLRKLKRGLPIDDTTPASRRVSLNSMSPVATTSTYTTVPPPAKRHQTSHPGHDGPPRPPEGAMYPPHQVERPTHQFYPAPQNSPSLPPPYQPNPNMYATRPPMQSPTMPTNHRMGPVPVEAGPYAPNGHTGSPHVSTQPPPPIHANHPPPPRIPSSNYDTRPPPPPPVSSGFPAVNHPPLPGGFPAVNARHTETPPAPDHQIPKDYGLKHQSKSVDSTPVRPNMIEERGGSVNNSTNKRTPSTTHPYQMSEAFANRHHHCERTDSINRGIWTWHGPGGTIDRPTGPATEMYLKCNHDGCGRIDWRTVHGLQCHIVKNHDQPKGTIGSLEKALDRYGVPVRDIEEIEKRDGLGSGGTMADPKTVKVRSRVRDVGDRRDLTGRSTPTSGGPPSFGQKQYHSNGSRSPSSASAPQRLDSAGKQNSYGDHYHDSGSESTPIDVEKHSQARPAGGFAAVNASWQTVNSTPSRRPPSRDHDMRDVQRAHPPNMARPHEVRSPPNAHAPVPSPAPALPTPFWPGWQSKTDVPLPKPQISSPQGPAPLRSTSSEIITIESGSTPSAQAVSETINQEKGMPESKPETAIKDPEKSDEIPVRSNNEPKQEPEVQDTEMTEAPNTASGTVDPPVVEEKGEETEKKKDTAEISTAQADKIVINTKTVTEFPPPLTSDQTDSTPVKDVRIHAEEEVKPIAQSPEISSRRISSRRESRRTSIATASSSKAGTDKGRDDDFEIPSTANKTSTAESVDNEGDSITVNVDAVKAEQKEREKERLKDDDRTSTPPRRLANGRFTRRPR